MLPSGAVSRISPSRGFSAANTTRNGAPFHGAIGEAKNASSAASSQAPGEPSASASIPEQRTKKNAPAISDTADLQRFPVIVSHLLRRLEPGSALESLVAHVLARRTGSTSPGHAVGATTNWRPGNNGTPCPLMRDCTIVAQTMAEIMAKNDLRDLDADPTAKSQRTGAEAHLNCSSTNHFLSFREQFLKPGACGGLPAGWGRLQWLEPPQ